MAAVPPKPSFAQRLVSSCALYDDLAGLKRDDPARKTFVRISPQSDGQLGLVRARNHFSQCSRPVLASQDEHHQLKASMPAAWTQQEPLHLGLPSERLHASFEELVCEQQNCCIEWVYADGSCGEPRRNAIRSPPYAAGQEWWRARRDQRLGQRLSRRDDCRAGSNFDGREDQSNGRFEERGTRSATRQRGEGKDPRRAPCQHEDQSTAALDGAADVHEDPTRQKGGAEKGRQDPVSVAQRIHRIEEKAKANAARRETVQNLTAKPPASIPNAKAVKPEDSSDIPMVFPLHVKRFVRRTGGSIRFEPQAPLNKSTPPSNDSVLHAPRAQRYLPNPENLEDNEDVDARRSLPAAGLDTTRGDHDPSIARNIGFGRRQSTNFAVRPTSQPGERGRYRISPTSYFQGTKERCVRHGRKPTFSTNARKEVKVTKDMFERSSRSGAYLPAGMNHRTQLEATSPWAFSSKESLIKWKGSEACPDCVAELNIKRREAEQPSPHDPIHTYDEPLQGGQQRGQTILDRKTHVFEIETGLPGQHNRSDDQRQQEGLVVTGNLGEGLDAAIFERGGRLERVIMNQRLGLPTVEALQKLSQDLLNISKTLASGSDMLKSNNEWTPTERTVIVEAAPHTKAHSVPQLMNLIDHAMDSNRLQPSEHASRTNRPRLVAGASSQSLLESDEVDAFLYGPCSPSSRLVHRQTMPDLTKISLPGMRNAVPSVPEPTRNEGRKDDERATMIPSIKTSPPPSPRTQSPTLPSHIFQTRHMSPEPPPTAIQLQSRDTVAPRPSVVAIPAVQSLLTTASDLFRIDTPPLLEATEPRYIGPPLPITSVAAPYRHAPATPRIPPRPQTTNNNQTNPSGSAEAPDRRTDDAEKGLIQPSGQPGRDTRRDQTILTKMEQPK